MLERGYIIHTLVFSRLCSLVLLDVAAVNKAYQKSRGLSLVSMLILILLLFV